MADSKVDFASLTSFIPEAVMNVSDLIKSKAFMAGSDLEQYVNIVSGITHRMKVGYLSTLGDVGKKGTGTGCSFNTQIANIVATEKEWYPKEWNFQLGLCSDDVKNTVGATALKKGVNVHDMSNTEIFDLFLEGLQDALMAMYHRYVWFGDTAAANTDDSPEGYISPAIDVNTLNICDGLFKRAYAIIAATPAQRVTVAANGSAYTTYATQKAAFTPALALSYIESMINDAPEAIQGELLNGSYQIHVTQKWFNQLKKNFTGTSLESMFTNLQNGVRALMIDGIPVVPRPDWDYGINKYENSGTKWHDPFRALLYEKNNALVGVPDVATWGAFDAYYWKKDHKMYIDAKDLMDTMFMYDNAIMFAV